MYLCGVRVWCSRNHQVLNEVLRTTRDIARNRHMLHSVHTVNFNTCVQALVFEFTYQSSVDFPGDFSCRMCDTREFFE